MVSEVIINLDYDLSQEQPTLIDTFKRMYQAMLDHAKAEEEKARDPNWEYRRVYVVSKKVFDLMTSPDTPPDIKRQLEWATFTGYQWIRKNEDNIFIDEKL